MSEGVSASHELIRPCSVEHAAIYEAVGPASGGPGVTVAEGKVVRPELTAGQ